MIEHFTQFIPNELKDKSGSVFYSGRSAFVGKKTLYILGLNPGGSEILQKKETILWHTNKVLENQNPNFSEYKDGVWGTSEAGKNGLQPRVLHLLKNIGLDPYEVPASNVCFVRSPREANIADKINGYIDLCWEFHQNVIDTLKIKSILCFGKTAGKHVRKKIEANVFVDEFIEKNNRKWKSQVHKNNVGQFVITVTHPSIADWTNEKTDVSHLVKKYC